MRLVLDASSSYYNRISLTKPQLQVGIARLREGDAVVCFSRKQVYALKQVQ